MSNTPPSASLEWIRAWKVISMPLMVKSDVKDRDAV
jgi:hypothetical protein